ncbi:MAG: glycosyltransferase [Carboxydocellales bacterium]
MLKVNNGQTSTRLPYVLITCWFLALLIGYLAGVGMSAKIALLSIGAVGLWLVIHKGEAMLPVLILGMGILLPSFKLVSGLPHLRPEELLVLLFLCYLPFRKQKLSLEKDSNFGRIMVALITATVVSIIFAALFLNYRFSFRDVFELVKPLKYYLIVLFVANINFTGRSFNKLLKYLWIFCGLFILAGLLEYLNPGGFKDFLLPYAPEKVAHARLASQRIMGLFGNPNYTGIFLMLVINLAFSFLLFQKNKLKAIVLYLIIINLAGIMLLLSMSRTALLATLISLGYLLVRALLLNRIAKRQVIGVLGVVLIVVAVFSGFYGQKFLWRFEEGVNLGTSTSFQAKLVLWKESIKLIKQSPVFGWGPAKEEMTTLVDNEYLLIMRRYGLVGLLIYLALYLNILIRSGRLAARAGSPVKAAYGYAVQGITAGFLIFNLTAGTFYNLQLMSVYFTLVGVLLALERTGTGNTDQDAGGGEGSRKTGKDFHFVVLSHRFPTVTDPVKGIYVWEQLEAILELKKMQTTIISPVPYAPKILWLNQKWRAYGKEAKEGKFRGNPVHYPRYPVIPGAPFFFLQGFSMFLSIYGLVRKISRQNPRVLLHAHTILPDGLAALLLKCCLKNISIICTLHGSDILVFPFRNKLTTMLTKKALKEMDKVVCVSAHLKSAALELCSREVEIVPNGVNPEKFTLSPQDFQQVQQIRERWGKGKLVLFVGNLIAAKGVKELLEGFSKLDSNSVLILVGRPYLKKYIEEFSRQNGFSDRVVITGPVPHQEIKHWMQACDVFILPSYSEGLPVVMLEAMSLGRPVIVTRVGGVPEVIADGENGILIPPRDAAAIQQALQKVLENPSLAARLGAAAQARVLQEYTWANNARQMLNIYPKSGLNQVAGR